MFRRCKIMKKANTIFEGELKKWMILPACEIQTTGNEMFAFFLPLKKSGRDIEVSFLHF